MASWLKHITGNLVKKRLPDYCVVAVHTDGAEVEDGDGAAGDVHCRVELLGTVTESA